MRNDTSERGRVRVLGAMHPPVGRLEAGWHGAAVPLGLAAQERDVDPAPCASRRRPAGNARSRRGIQWE
jgi:hypothetical protein